MSSKNLIFSTIPDTNVQYSDFDLSHDAKLSLNLGHLVPVQIRECLPGETYDIDISSFVRMAPMVYPVLQSIKGYFHTFFVPNRLIFKDWNKFIWQGEGKKPQTTPLPLTDVSLPTFTPANLMLAIDTAFKSMGYPDVEAYEEILICNLFFYGSNVVPKGGPIDAPLTKLYEWIRCGMVPDSQPTGDLKPNSATLLSDYLGLHYSVDRQYLTFFCTQIGVLTPSGQIGPTAPKLNTAYNKLYDEVERQKRTVNLSYEAFLKHTQGRSYNFDAYTLLYKDYHPLLNYILYYFLEVGSLSTPISCLPFRAYNLIYDSFYRYEPISEQTVDWDAPQPNPNELLHYIFTRPRAWEHDYFTSALPSRQKGQALTIPVSEISIKGTDQTGEGSLLASKDIYANGDNKLYQENTAQLEIINKATALVNDLRTAIKLQSFNELFARVGSRVYEALKGIFNVTSQDARLDVPEYIQGSTMDIQVSEVVQTSASTEASSLGDYAGHGIGAGKGDHIHYVTNEHGYLVTFFSIRPSVAYLDFVPKMFNRQTYLDFAWPQLATLGEQEINNREIMTIGEVKGDKEENVQYRNDGIFGYIPRYSEYKYQFDRICGDFRDRETFVSWTMARRFTTSPNLNEDFVMIDTQPNRVFAYTHFDYDHFYMQAHFNIRARLPLPLYSNPTF